MVYRAGTEEFKMTSGKVDQAHPDVSILVVSYNTRDMTVACLQSVLAKVRGVNVELIVVDNASTDGSATAIDTAVPEAHLIRLEKNIGFGRANNLAARDARGRYLLLLNPDTLLRHDAVTAIVDFAGRCPDALIWGGRTVFADGSLNPTSCWRDPGLWSLVSQLSGLSRVLSRSELFNWEAYGGWQRDRERRVDIVTGCFLLIERSFWESLDGFDPDYFMYAEETDLCYRARLCGARPAFTPTAEIVHYDGASEAIRGPRMVRIFQGRVTYFRKHWSIPRRTAALALVRGFVLSRVLGYDILARVAGHNRFSGTAEQWMYVWRHRADWLSGYPGYVAERDG